MRDQEELNLDQILRVSEIERSQVKVEPITPGHAEFCCCPACVPLSEKDKEEKPSEL